MGFLQMSLSGSILILAIVVIRALAMNQLPKKTFLALWAVAVFRLLIPFSIPSRFSLYTLLGGLASPPKARWVLVSDASADLAGSVGSASWTSLLPLIWIVGSLALAVFFIIANWRCHRKFRSSLPVTDLQAAAWLQAHPTARGIRLRQSDQVASPLTYGILRPVILMPKGFDWSDEERLRYVLTHEYLHIRRFDPLMKLFLLAVLCLHWWNPLVWVMVLLANRDLELSCDESVLRLVGETMKSNYALALLRMEETKSGLSPLCSNFSKNAIEERITAIMNMKKLTLTGAILAVALVAGTTTVLATSASPETSGTIPMTAVKLVPASEGKAEDFTTETILATMTVAAISIEGSDVLPLTMLTETDAKQIKLIPLEGTETTPSIAASSLVKLVEATPVE